MRDWGSWFVWGLVREFGGGETFTRWATSGGDDRFLIVAGGLLAALLHLIAQFYNCFGEDFC